MKQVWLHEHYKRTRSEVELISYGPRPARIMVLSWPLLTDADDRLLAKALGAHQRAGAYCPDEGSRSNDFQDAIDLTTDGIEYIITCK